jgi:hypothetical protein
MSRVNIKNQDPRLLAMLGITLIAILVLVSFGPIPQPAAYHAFADQRSLWGIPHSNDTLTNLPFLLVGLAGLFALRRGVPAGGLPMLRPAYLLYFAGTALLFPTSGYYHLWPSDATLLWDRLAMTIAFMAFLAIIIGEYIDPRWSLRLLAPLVAFGMGTVVYWRLTDSGDGGDLRPYVLVQFLPMVLIPFIALAYRPLLRPVWYLWALLVSYGLAKLLELLDEPILHLTHLVSGHSLKHLVAAVGIAFFLLGLYQRRPQDTLATGS